MVASATCKLQQGDDENALLTSSYYVAQNNFFDASISFRMIRYQCYYTLALRCWWFCHQLCHDSVHVSEEETEVCNEEVEGKQRTATELDPPLPNEAFVGLLGRRSAQDVDASKGSSGVRCDRV
jgi:hypothetical protein